MATQCDSAYQMVNVSLVLTTHSFRKIPSLLLLFFPTMLTDPSSEAYCFTFDRVTTKVSDSKWVIAYCFMTGRPHAHTNAHFICQPHLKIFKCLLNSQLLHTHLFHCLSEETEKHSRRIMLGVGQHRDSLLRWNITFLDFKTTLPDLRKCIV